MGDVVGMRDLTRVIFNKNCYLSGGIDIRRSGYLAVLKSVLLNAVYEHGAELLRRGQPWVSCNPGNIKRAVMISALISTSPLAAFLMGLPMFRIDRRLWLITLVTTVL